MPQPLNTTNQPGLGKPSCDFARAVRECLASGVLSPQAAAMLGFAGTLECTVASLPASLKALAHQVMSSGSPAREQELDLSLEGRGLVVLRVSAVPVRSAEGVGAALALTDVS